MTVSVETTEAQPVPQLTAEEVLDTFIAVMHEWNFAPFRGVTRRPGDEFVMLDRRTAEIVAEKVSAP